MNIFVLYDRSGIHSGRALGSSLIERRSTHDLVQKGRPNRLALQLRKRSYDYIVNIGYYRDLPISNGTTVLNKPSAISISSNKKKARIHFKKSKIAAPSLFIDYTSAPKNAYPLVGRTTHHTKGRGFWLCKTPAEARRAVLKGATHFMSFVPNTREFRVHVMAPCTELSKLSPDSYNVIKLSEKIATGPGANQVIKSHDRGWRFSYPHDRSDEALKIARNVARKAIHAFGMHWGAVDLIISNDTKKPYVLEINSAPCLTDLQTTTLDKYTEGITAMIQNKYMPPTTPKPRNTKSALRAFSRRVKV